MKTKLIFLSENLDAFIASLANETAQNLELGQCRSSLRGHCGEADTGALQPGLACAYAPRASLLESPAFLWRGRGKLKRRQGIEMTEQASNRMEDLELPERKVDESWNTSFIVNIPKDQADGIEGKDENLGRGRQTNLKQVFLRLEGQAWSGLQHFWGSQLCQNQSSLDRGFKWKVGHL